MSLQFKEKNVRIVLGWKINDNSIEDTFIVWGETQDNVFKNTKNVKCFHIIGSDNDSQAGNLPLAMN